MTEAAFTTELLENGNLLVGPWRRPKQMLHAQVYDSHASIHDDATAQKLGFQGGTIEGPTHFSQFAPLCERIWGQAWFETGCLSAHYRNPAFEGEEVQANIEKPKAGQTICAIGMTKRDGTEILRGTASIGGDGSETALSRRLGELKPLADPVILADIVKSIGRDLPLVRQALSAIKAKAAGSFAGLDRERREALIDAWYATGGAPAAALGRAILGAYYRDDRVLQSLGHEARAPFPKGYTVEQGDWSLLEVVKKRPAFWRDDRKP